MTAIAAALGDLPSGNVSAAVGSLRRRGLVVDCAAPPGAENGARPRIYVAAAPEATALRPGTSQARAAPGRPPRVTPPTRPGDDIVEVLAMEVPALRAYVRSVYDGIDVEVEDLVLSNRPVPGL